MLYVVHLTETDGDIHFERLFTIDETKQYIESQGLIEDDYTIIHGNILTIGELK